MIKTPRWIAIETSSARLSVAIGTPNSFEGEFQGPLQWRHAESLFEAMHKVLRQARWPIQSLTGVVVSTGPGSFTGIRIGLAAARALGQSLKIPVVGFSSLQGIAYPLLKPGRLVSPVINALRGEVFSAVYTMDKGGGIKTLVKAACLPAEEWATNLLTLKKEIWIAGDAVKLYPSLLRNTLGVLSKSASQRFGYPLARTLLQLGRERLVGAGSGSYRDVLPVYLRRAAAQERLRA